MALQSITNISIDFYDQKYILINAKQYDKKTRFLSVTCYNHGELFNVDYRDHAAYIRYKKADGHSVFNFCEITKDGKILVELTEQMLAANGICYADFVLVNRGQAEVDAETGEIVNIDRASVLSTMLFCIDVSDTAVENSEIESTYEFNLVNKTIERYWTNFEEVVRAAKSFAIGQAGGYRPNEDIDNAKYYYEQVLDDAEEVAANAEAASKSAANAKTSETNAAKWESYAKGYMDNAYTYMDRASTSEQNAKASETNALSSKQNALLSEQNAKTSEINAANSETNAFTSALMAQRYTVGGTGTDGEDTDNAKWYYNEIKDMFVGLNIVFVPKGTISFSELATAKETAVAGYVYNISDDFVTDESFREGSGHSYTAGTNVYYTIDEVWDCFGGTATPIATVDEVKEFLSI